MLRIALGLSVAPVVLMIASLAVVHHDAVRAADDDESLPQGSRLALNEVCDPASVLLSIDDVPDGLMLEREEEFWAFESSLRRTFRGTLPQRNRQSITELIIQVEVLPSEEAAVEHMLSSWTEVIGHGIVTGTR